jgi:uncharacterized protein YndB with AHSA1/START domain
MAGGSAVTIRRLSVPPREVWGLLADVDAWPRWGPFRRADRPMRPSVPGLPRPVRYGRHLLQVVLSSPDPPYWLRYRLVVGAGRQVVAGEITLAPTDDGGTEVRWDSAATAAAGWAERRRARQVATRVPPVLEALAAYVESPVGAVDAWTGPLVPEV